MNKMVTVRVTEKERDKLNFEAQFRQISLNTLLREKLNLTCDITPKKKPLGNPDFVRIRGMKK